MYSRFSPLLNFCRRTFVPPKYQAPFLLCSPQNKSLLERFIQTNIVAVHVVAAIYTPALAPSPVCSLSGLFYSFYMYCWFSPLLKFCRRTFVPPKIPSPFLLCSPQNKSLLERFIQTNIVAVHVVAAIYTPALDP